VKKGMATLPLKIMTELRMSNADATFVDRALFFQKRALREGDDICARGENFPRIYNLVKYAKDELIPALLLASSIRKAEFGTGEIFDNSLYNIYKFYIERYLPHQKNPALLNGDDLVNKFNLKPSPLFKTILDNIEEARVLNVINTESEAEALVHGIITKHKRDS